jgi:hypothetical protein
VLHKPEANQPLYMGLAEKLDVTVGREGFCRHGSFALKMCKLLIIYEVCTSCTLSCHHSYLCIIGWSHSVGTTRVRLYADIDVGSGSAGFAHQKALSIHNVSGLVQSIGKQCHASKVCDACPK